MNPIITQYFQDIEIRLIQSDIILSYDIVRHEIGLTDGKLRCLLRLPDDHMAECFVYITEDNGRLRTDKYSFHWQNKAEKLQERWDNAPHFPNLPNAPHHRHLADGSVISANQSPDFIAFLKLPRIPTKLTTPVAQTLLFSSLPFPLPRRGALPAAHSTVHALQASTDSGGQKRVKSAPTPTAAAQKLRAAP